MNKLLLRRLRSLLTLCLSILMLLASLAHADKLTPQIAEALIKESGLADQLPSITPSVAAGLTLNPGLSSNLSEEQLQIVLKAFSNAYSPQRLLTGIAAEMLPLLKAADGQQALTWFRSDLGRKITGLEDAASKTASDSAVMEQAQALYQRLSPRRSERYERLAKASEVAESSAELLINTSTGTAYGVASTAAAATSPDIDEIRREFSRSRDQMVASLGIQFNVLFASAYQSLPEAELDQYIAFVESPAGTAFHKAMATAIDRAMIKAAREAGTQIAGAFKPRNRRPADE